MQYLPGEVVTLMHEGIQKTGRVLKLLGSNKVSIHFYCPSLERFLSREIPEQNLKLADDIDLQRFKKDSIVHNTKLRRELSRQT